LLDHIVTGAGIAGLAFPLALRKQWPSKYDAEFPTIVIYERDDLKTQIGREGYSISIRGDALAGGIQALQKIGILEKLLDVSLTGRDNSTHTDGETSQDRGAFCLWDLKWNCLLRMTGKATDNELPAPSMRIKRDALRTVLIAAVDAISHVTMHWRTPCLSAEISPGAEQPVKVCLADDRVDYSDFLIVADGAGSKVRSKLRPTDTLNYAGICMISGTARFGENEIPKPMDKNWGGVLGGGGIGLFVSAVDSRSALWALSYPEIHARDRLAAPMSEEQVQSVLQEALELGRPFMEPLPTLIKATDPSTLTVMNAMDKQPFAHDNGCPIIFIGDSNHAMSPFAGNGANMALCDAWDLAEQLCQSKTLEHALRTYDGLSMPRSSKAIDMSHWSISLLHSQGLKLLCYKLCLAVLRLFI
jgi:2-polyprenyl-6-methoxyphenol hydroxylase-like FAD-dependent oxidoreductase